MGRKNSRRHEYRKRLPTVVEMRSPKRMDIWFAHLRKHTGSSVQEGDRPVLIVSNDVGNDRAGIVTVLPLTTRLKRLEQPTHCVIGNPLDEESLVLAEQITTIGKACLIRKVGACKDEETIKKIEAAMRVQLGLEEEHE